MRPSFPHDPLSQTVYRSLFKGGRTGPNLRVKDHDTIRKASLCEKWFSFKNLTSSRTRQVNSER
jgi:hypothetical protein